MIHLLALFSIICITIFLVCDLKTTQIIPKLKLNLALRTTLRGLVSDQSLLPVAETELSQAPIHANCREYWYQGVVAKALGDETESEAAWGAMIRCSPDFIPLLQIVAPHDVGLAELAIEAQPRFAEAWFWLGKMWFETAQGDPIPLYRQGLLLDPGNGLRWCELGETLKSKDLQAAIQAYLQCCHHGDPGGNGCWQAGGAAERLGEIENAIQYYRYSGWDVAQARANELEAQLVKQSKP